MPLKTHLIIVSVIVVMLTAGWQMVAMLQTRPAAPEAPKGIIQVVRASWGLNCDPGMLAADAATPRSTGQYSENANSGGVHENNVHDPISKLCNGKSSCAIVNSPDTLGFDPAPSCFDKQILVEYRCYAFDRLWQITVPPHDTATVDCTKILPPQNATPPAAAR